MLPLDVIKRRLIVHNCTRDEHDTTRTASFGCDYMGLIKASGQGELFWGCNRRAAVKMKI